MSLRVWLPLNGDLENRGLDGDLQISSIGTLTFINNGKIGKCYQRASSSSQTTTGININDNFLDIFGTKTSVAMWVKPLGTHTHYNGTLLSSGNWNNKKWAFGVNQNNTKVDVLCGSYNNYIDCQVPIDIWTHLVSVYDNGTCILYKNGEFVGQLTNQNAFQTDVLNTCIGRQTYANGYFGFNGLINDVRIYDHALSLKQIKEISKGLILHYKLDHNAGDGLNLLKNGFGELGNQYWPGGGDPTDIPSGVPQIKMSFYPSTNSTSISIKRNMIYHISAWIKASSNTGITYPSLLPYDIDGKFIYYYNSRVGFNLNTMTTITQILKPGDTEIHVASLEQWDANSGTYYNYAAIFNYQDSTGHIYPDGTYTQNTPSFGSGTQAKTNLDKTNNIITLNSAYDGPIISVGTYICAATAGATFYYPFGGISCSTIQDWTYKQATFTSENDRLLAATTVKFKIFTSSKMAGIKIINKTLLEDKIYDSSGYENHGDIVNSISQNDFSPKYAAATSFNGTSAINCVSLTPEAKTISLWVKWDAIPSYQSVVFLDYKSKLGLGLMSTGILCGTSGPGNYNTFSKTGLIANTWYHFVVINPGEATKTDRKLYINGIEQEKTSNVSNWTYNIDQIQIGKRSTTSDGLIGKISDVRLYATVLSPEDIKELYQTSALIDRNQNLYVRELVEI